MAAYRKAYPVTLANRTPRWTHSRRGVLVFDAGCGRFCGLQSAAVSKEITHMNVEEHRLFNAIQSLNPKVKKYTIGEYNIHRLSEWSPKTGHREIITGHCRELHELAHALAKQHGGLVETGGGSGCREFPQSANYSGIEITDEVLEEAVRLNKVWHEEIDKRVKAMGPVRVREVDNPEKNREPE